MPFFIDTINGLIVQVIIFCAMLMLTPAIVTAATANAVLIDVMVRTLRLALHALGIHCRVAVHALVILLVDRYIGMPAFIYIIVSVFHKPALVLQLLMGAKVCPRTQVCASTHA